MNSLRSHLLHASSACALLALYATAHATVIQPDTAVASSVFSSSYAAINTINGSGLAGAVGTLPTHAAYSATTPVGGNHWTTAAGTNPLDAYITWGFTSAQTLDTIYLWNHQSNGGIANNSGYDVGNFALTFYNSSNAVIGTYSGTLAFDSNAAQAFNFGALAGISSVRFDVNSVQSSTNYTGLAEVAFNTTSVNPNNTPDAASTAGLLGLSVLALGFFSRRLSPV
jgi:hypothetical protein